MLLGSSAIVGDLFRPTHVVRGELKLPPKQSFLGRTAHEREQYDREERPLEREFEHGEGEAGESIDEYAQGHRSHADEHATTETTASWFSLRMQHTFK